MRLLSLQDFAAALDQRFDLDLGTGSTMLTLIGVKPLPADAYPGTMRDPFVVTFRSESQLVLPQRAYRMRNAAMGEHDIFIVPVARDPQGVRYDAVFS